MYILKLIYMESFNEKYRNRSFQFAVKLVKYIMKLRESGLPYDLFSQLLKCGTSFPANFRAATQARSDAEYYSKICITVEECDETVFWLYLLEKSSLAERNEELVYLQKESEELVKIFSNLKQKVAKRIGKTYSPHNLIIKNPNLTPNP
ncbi:MAG: four helix bundle protein [Bacteroidales bacterium]